MEERIIYYFFDDAVEFIKVVSYHILNVPIRFKMLVCSFKWLRIDKTLEGVTLLCSVIIVKRLRSPYTWSRRSKSYLVQGIRHRVGLFYFNIKLVMIIFLQQYIKPTDLKNHFMYMHHSRGNLYCLFVLYLLITKRGRNIVMAWHGLRGRQGRQDCFIHGEI